jgi:hypothetical protein
MRKNREKLVHETRKNLLILSGANWEESGKIGKKQFKPHQTSLMFSKLLSLGKGG